MDNLRYYNEGRKVPEEAQKAFNNGKFQGTDINPMWRIKKLTELFGPCGIGWYVDNVTERAETHGEVTMAIVNLELFIKVDGEWSMPIYGTGGNVLLRKGSPSDEGYKMAYTDALSVACKALGIGADVYYSKDKTKYTAASETPTEAPKAKPEPKAKKEVKEPEAFTCSDCGKELSPAIVDGTTYGVRQIAAGSSKRCGRVLCWACYTKERVKEDKQSA